MLHRIHAGYGGRLQGLFLAMAGMILATAILAPTTGLSGVRRGHLTDACA